MIDASFRLQKLIEMEQNNPADPFIKFALAQEYYAKNDLENAEKYYAVLLRHFPDYLPTYFHFGKLKQMNGCLDEAKKLFLQGINLAQRQGEAKTHQELLQALGELDDE
ncbi:MAG: hypothetical protein RMJ53_01240 [Chitinophagales bacterium]|nr:hypothetical protein [Chitinophagales bacterium]MDW8272831.1 hypothetical protein [Chitinophagales bacterium]